MRVLTFMCLCMLVTFVASSQVTTLPWHPVSGPQFSKNELQISKNRLYLNKLRSIDLDELDRWEVNLPSGVPRDRLKYDYFINDGRYHFAIQYHRSFNSGFSNTGISHISLWRGNAVKEGQIEKGFGTTTSFEQMYGSWGSGSYMTGVLLSNYSYTLAVNDSLLYTSFNIDRGSGSGTPIVREKWVRYSINSGQTYKTGYHFPDHLITDNINYISLYVDSDSLYLSNKAHFSESSRVKKYIPPISEYIDGVMLDSLLLVASTNTLLVSSDLGDAWEVFETPNQIEIYNVELDSTTQTYYLFSKEQVYQSANPALNDWQLVYDYDTNPYSAAPTELLIDDINYWLTDSDTIEYSRDLGQTWTAINDIPYVYEGDLYAIGNELWTEDHHRSLDGGETWENLTDKFVVENNGQLIAFEPLDNVLRIGDHYFVVGGIAGQDTVVYYSDEMLNNWEVSLEYSLDYPINYPVQRRFWFTNNNIFIQDGQQLHRYDGTTQNWDIIDVSNTTIGLNEFNKNHDISRVQELKNRIFITTWSRKHFVSSDNGATWETFEMPSDLPPEDPSITGYSVGELIASDNFLFVYDNFSKGFWSNDLENGWQKESNQNNAVQATTILGGYVDVIEDSRGSYISGESIFSVGDVLFHRLTRYERSENYTSASVFPETFISVNKGRSWVRVEDYFIEPDFQCVIGDQAYFRGMWSLDIPTLENIVYEKPDLEVYLEEIEIDYFERDDSIFIDLYVQNNTTFPIDSSFEVTYRLINSNSNFNIDLYHLKQTFNTFAPLEKQVFKDTIVLNQQIPARAYNLQVTLETGNKIEEDITNNNVSLTNQFNINSIPKIEIDTTITICHGASYNGIEYQTNQTFRDTFELFQLDSIFITRLRIDRIIESVWIDLCESDSILFNDVYYTTEPGIHIDTLKTVDLQCDSFVALYITPLYEESVIENITLQEGELFLDQIIENNTVITVNETAQNGCDSTIVYIINVLTSTDELAMFSSIEVFPNPVNDQFQIRSTAMESYELRLLDINSKVVNTWILPANGNLQTDIGELPNGLYILEIDDGNSKEYRKIIKQ